MAGGVRGDLWLILRFQLSKPAAEKRKALIPLFFLFYRLDKCASHTVATKIMKISTLALGHFNTIYIPAKKKL